jgi:large subunit ribosomal protein L13e
MKTVKAKVLKGVGKQRLGRGFSRDELRKAGTSLTEAVKLGVPVDSRRKTAHDENVEVARAFLVAKKASLKASQKPKKKPKS